MSTSTNHPAAIPIHRECADVDVPTFEAVLAALRDVERNPEWKFVREGPTWRGRRVPAWRDLFA